MKIHYVIAVLLALVWGCNNKNSELEKQNADLQSKAGQLNQELSSRDEYIENVTQAINEIYTNIEAVRSKEKMILNESHGMESMKKATTKEEIRERLLQEISAIDSNLSGNWKKIHELQSKVNSYRAQFAGLRKMISNLKQTLEEREQSIAQLELKVKGLEEDLVQSKQFIAQRDSIISQRNIVIDFQTKEINTGFYIIGSRKDLESKGIIAKEGGFLWGLLGSTTVLTSGFNREYFKPLNKWEEMTIEVSGKINEIVPKRSEKFYSETLSGTHQSVLRIREPKNFWENNFLVIITD